MDVCCVSATLELCRGMCVGTGLCVWLGVEAGNCSLSQFVMTWQQRKGQARLAQNYQMCQFSSSQSCSSQGGMVYEFYMLPENMLNVLMSGNRLHIVWLLWWNYRNTICSFTIVLKGNVSEIHILLTQILSGFWVRSASQKVPWQVFRIITSKPTTTELILFISVVTNTYHKSFFGRGNNNLIEGVFYSKHDEWGESF